MKIYFEGKQIGYILTGSSMTIEEAVKLAFEDAETEYSKGNPAAYMDDFGNFCWDYEKMEMDYSE
ncbi:MAG: hypothetical protein NC084_12035 [Bacteroides sp.]|nr:hypothetical protein [Eubacterium sp.]MCM1419290.1 hypothetical protein [Roseburia sp.]MCM1463422.1 hypothetical protein [Bacteroides sp.]